MAASLLVIGQACRRPEAPLPMSAATVSPAAARMGWAIQAGAFSNPDNAARLAEGLSAQGLGATHFRDADGFHKVRFGDFPGRDGARRIAEGLRSKGTLEDFFLVAPESLPGSKVGEAASLPAIRKSLVSTAERYLGLPYLWGGTSPRMGFDCSGLTQAVYRLNGLSIPRTSREQFAKGRPVKKGKLKDGDLVFFATGKGGAVNHVAIYAGGGTIIHAPRPGTNIRTDSMSNPVLSKQYVGARCYL